MFTSVDESAALVLRDKEGPTKMPDGKARQKSKSKWPDRIGARLARSEERALRALEPRITPKVRASPVTVHASRMKRLPRPRQVLIQCKEDSCSPLADVAACLFLGLPCETSFFRSGGAQNSRSGGVRRPQLSSFRERRSIEVENRLVSRVFWGVRFATFGQSPCSRPGPGLGSAPRATPFWGRDVGIAPPEPSKTTGIPTSSWPPFDSKPDENVGVRWPQLTQCPCSHAI